VASTPRHNQPHAIQQTGFSLIEVMIVVVIIGAMATVAVPRYANSLARYRADAAARRITADLSLAQTAARQASTTRQVSFDTGNDTYQLPGVTPLHGPGDNLIYYVDLKESPYQAQITSATLGADAILIFDGYGNPDSDGTVVIQVGTEQRQVVINAETGEATVQ
jgi:prepilin-type N-terminal cleavage/methylation domain-containing protein